MSNRTWTLSGDPTTAFVDWLDIGPNDAPELPGEDWALRKKTLRGGPSDGVEVVEINNGPLSLEVLPTRGMSIWRGNCNGVPLGWTSPVARPVHPKFVNLADRNGLGWLTGFNEWICRCGLVSNGPPGNDGTTPLTLHGRIANTPASSVVFGTDMARTSIFVRGVVEEGGLFLGRLRLTSTISMRIDTVEFEIHDVVENLSAQPAELQMLYHINTGEPFLESGSRVIVPFRELAPHTTHAAQALGTFDQLAGPVAGFAEEVFDFKPADDHGSATALLKNPTGDLGLAVTWNVEELPCFTVWKNTAAREDGYVVGLEPSTNFPYFKAHERAQQRVVALPPRGRWGTTLRLRVCTSPSEVRDVEARIAAIQSTAKGVIHSTPVWGPGVPK